MDLNIVSVCCFSSWSRMATRCDWVDSSHTTWLF